MKSGAGRPASAVRLSREEREKAQAFIAALGQRTLEVGGRAPFDWLVPAFGDVVSCPYASAHRVVSAGSSWDVEFAEFSGGDPEMLERWKRFLRRASATPAAYDPERPEAAQRNVVMTFEDLSVGPGTTAAHVRDVLLPQVGLGGYDQIRILVCDGPRLLAWIGGFCPGVVAQRQRAMAERILPWLVSSLALDRRLRDCAAVSQCLDAALEALCAPAFIVDRRGHVVHANRVGRTLADRDPKFVSNQLHDRIRQGPHASPDADVSRVGVPSATDLWLVILRDGDSVRDARVEQWRRTHGLTPREAEVLSRLVRGESNKAIAKTLACAEVTVELHITRILRKSRLETRLSLACRFWQL